MFHQLHSSNMQDLAAVPELLAPLCGFRCDPAAQEEAPVTIDVRVRKLVSLGLASIEDLAVQAERDRTMIARDGNDSVMLLLAPRGRARVSQPDWRDAVVISSQQAALVRNDRPWQARSVPGTSVLYVCIPRTLISARVTGLDGGWGHVVPGGACVGLLTSYAQELLEGIEALPPEVEALADRHLGDLVSLVLAPMRDVLKGARLRGLRAARLNAIKLDIRANISNFELTLDWVAKRHGISPFYVRALFRSENASFTRFVLGARLDCARRLLTDKRAVDRSITAIALESGFSDLSWFNAAFRRRFNVRPSHFRQLVQSMTLDSPVALSPVAIPKPGE